MTVTHSDGPWLQAPDMAMAMMTMCGINLFIASHYYRSQTNERDPFQLTMAPDMVMAMMTMWKMERGDLKTQRFHQVRRACYCFRDASHYCSKNLTCLRKH